jgi:hypothetical protein
MPGSSSWMPYAPQRVKRLDDDDDDDVFNIKVTLIEMLLLKPLFHSRQN